MPDGLSARFRADSISGVVNGAKVSKWSDISGNGYVASQATAANQPTLNLSGPSVVFDGSTSYMPSNGATGGNQQSIVAIIRRSNSSTSGQAFRGSSRNNTFEARIANNVQNNQSFSITDLGSGTTSIGTSITVLTTTFSNGGSSYFWVNGASAGSASATAPGYGVDGSLGVIGGQIHNNGGIYDYFSGEIFEVMWWQRVISATERAVVHSYVQDRYGVTVSDYVSM